MKATWLAGIIVLLGAGAGVYFSLGGNDVEKQTAVIAAKDVTEISESWNGQTLKDMADPGLINAMTSQGQSPEELLKVYSALGKLVAPPECKAKSNSTTIKGGKQHVMIGFECPASYQKGEAVVSLTLTKSESETRWLIYYINIRSDIFAEVIE